MTSNSPQTIPTTNDVSSKTPTSAQVKKSAKTIEPVSAQDLSHAFEEQTAVIDNPTVFSIAVGKAQQAGDEYVEVTEELFRFLCAQKQSEYLIYGNPAVRVYRPGTRERIEKLEAMTPEEKIRFIMSEPK